MRIQILICLLISTFGFAQTKSNKLNFDKKYFEVVDNWVSFPKNKIDSTYYYGFIYLDEQAGFTYQMGSTFKIDKNNNYILAKVDSTLNVKYRIDSNWKTVAIIPKEKFSELKLPEKPEWLAIYKEDSDKASYLKNIGYHYNHAGASHLALEPLKKAYDIDSHFEGLEFEFAYAYNALKQFNKSILILEKAIKNNPKNFYFYRELGYAYKYTNQIEQAEKIYKKGIQISKNKFEKSEMSVNMAQTYFQLKNRKKFDEWAKLTKKYSENNSQYAKYIDMFEKEWGKK